MTNPPPLRAALAPVASKQKAVFQSKGINADNETGIKNYLAQIQRWNGAFALCARGCSFRHCSKFFSFYLRVE